MDATGAACLLVHRDVFAKTERWFDRRQIDGEWVGEDLSFCLKVREAGYDVLVDTALEFDHLRAGRMNWETYESRLQTFDATRTMTYREWEEAERATHRPD